MPGQQKSTVIRYQLLDLDLHAHEFVLRMHVPAPVSARQRLQLASWIPGSYMIRDFARNITQIAARDDHGPVPLEKIDKQTWELGECQGAVWVDYRVYAFDLSVRAAYLDQTRAYFNGTSLFLRVPGLDDEAWELELPAPDHDVCRDWRVATSLPELETDERGFGRYAGRGYDRLTDCPVEIGTFESADFDVAGVSHRFVVSEGGRFDIERICRDLQRVCTEHVEMFGDSPIAHYTFLTLATADGYGGLEHCDSTSLMCKRADLPAAGLDRPDQGYRQFLGLCSHEYFHLWNVKRIRPARLAEADLGVEAHTELLWAFEGITSYYDELALVRSGVLSVEDYLDLFAGTVSRVLRTPGRARQSVAESSFDAWTKFYKQDENAPNAIVSYYTKGALVALGLDVTLRIASDDMLCLDDLMRRLWLRYGKTAIGVPERGIEHEIADLLGKPLDDFFTRYVYGTEELPLQEWFASFGLGFRARPARDRNDNGGHHEEAPADLPAVGLGARYEQQGNGLRLTQVISSGPAQRAGLAPGDVLVAVDGERVTDANLVALLARTGGATVEVHFFRRDRLTVTQLSDFSTVADTCDLWLLPEGALAEQVRARRLDWLSSRRRHNA